ncbi:hypothetical protein AGDE_09706 [Angomonas deanei]|nr:hypothetical protein AGDE_09706 [Angomonas deanei]|eukprot:EPY29914.1 hypothetical protein AGDE_09706 [Angomonas deanei]
MDKAVAAQSKYDQLTHVVLKNENITVAVKSSEVNNNNDDELKKTNMKSLLELDVSGNAALTMTELKKLISYFPRLATLQTSDIPTLLPSRYLPTSTVLGSENITKIVFNNVGFKSIGQLKSFIAMQNLKELHLDCNEIENFVLFSDAEEKQNFTRNKRKCISFENVEVLSLAHNKIKHWRRTDPQNKENISFSETIETAFPNLKQLFLTDNRLTNVTPEEMNFEKNKEHDNLENYYLSKLTLFCVHENPSLTHVRTLDYIRHYCNNNENENENNNHLRVFRISYEFLLPQWNPTLSRMYVIASLPLITLLNRGEVRKKERYDSELFYVQRGLARREALQEHEKEKENNNNNNENENNELYYPDYNYLETLHAIHKNTVISVYKEGSTALTDGVMVDLTLETDNLYTKKVIKITKIYFNKFKKPSRARSRLPN